MIGPGPTASGDASRPRRARGLVGLGARVRPSSAARAVEPRASPRRDERTYPERSRDGAGADQRRARGRTGRNDTGDGAAHPARDRPRPRARSALVGLSPQCPLPPLSCSRSAPRSSPLRSSTRPSAVRRSSRPACTTRRTSWSTGHVALWIGPRRVVGSNQDAGSASYRCPVTGCANGPTIVEGDQGGSTFVTQD
jgi:hypothetical protein